MDITLGPDDRAACSLCRDAQIAREDYSLPLKSASAQHAGKELQRITRRVRRSSPSPSPAIIPSFRPYLNIGGVSSDIFPVSSDPLSVVVDLLKASITLCQHPSR
ncbi:hypothetical protein F511_32114 [Dorcoceras hygrometricum]|uniref:Uncharacterized protein n=1 Tax=Dorcoceras hygrometricum TaxID=472368 RepID=A0A2Z7AN29_9LAMI|nr:hypothetical protein F511_32114 [Dorcoceras hygrometricum]